MIRVEFLTENGDLIALNGKSIHGPAFKRHVALCSEARVEDGLWTVDYFVLDVLSGFPFGIGKTKADALSMAREHCERCDWPRVSVFLGRYEKAKEDRLLRLREAANQIAEIDARPRAIRNRRRKVFDASGGKCAYCSIDLEVGGRWQIDHKIPRSKGGTDLPDNLTAACIGCNQKKSDRTAEEFEAVK